MPVLLRDRREGRGAVEEPLIDLGARGWRCRIERAARFLGKVFENGPALAKADARAAGPRIIDERRDLVARADLHEVGRELLFLREVDRPALIGKARLLDPL